MAATVLPPKGGRIGWELTRDDEGHRDYIVRFRAFADSVDDGPGVVMNATGLPAVGAFWAQGNAAGHDVWAFAMPGLRIRQDQQQGTGPGRHWTIEQHYSTRPVERCQLAEIQDPLDEPEKVSGSFVRRTQEKHVDRFGKQIKNSAHELIHGPKAEYDETLLTVIIEQNVATLGLNNLSGYMNNVNSVITWGQAVRTIKLSSVTFERRLAGNPAICNYYFTRKFEFEIDKNKRWDRDDIADEGTRVIRGSWSTTKPHTWVIDPGPPAASPTSASDFIRAVDVPGNPIHAQLDGSGSFNESDPFNPVTIPDGQGGNGPIEHYPQVDLMDVLSIQTNLEGV